MSLKILAVVDKQNTAIDRLAQGMKPFHSNLDYVVCDIHPKRPSEEQLQRFLEEAQNTDLIDWQYFKTALALRERYPWVKEKKQILTMHNPYSLGDGNWDEFNAVVANSKYIYDQLTSLTTAPVEYIGNTADTNFFTFNPDWTPGNRVLMVANRIEGKKGILPVAKACREIGVPLDLVGSVSSSECLHEIMQTGVVTFHEAISDEALKELYWQASIYVFNSVDNFESSGQPLLEAMLTGVPVLTRNIGIVPELNNGENLVLNESQPEDVEHLIELLSDMLNDKARLRELRDKAWQTAKVRANERRAYEYQKLYRAILYPNTRSVSVIMPVCGHADVTRRNLDAIAKQTYKNIELIVPDDGLGRENRAVVEEFSLFVGFPVCYIRTTQLIIDPQSDEIHKDYGLARARNIAADLATGELLVFIDQRQAPEPDGIEQLVKHAKERYWIFGDKGSGKREFIENYSLIYRHDFEVTGGFNERCNQYGALSEDTRKRVRYQGIKTEFIPSARAKAIAKSSNRNRKRDEIIKSKTLVWKRFGAID